MGENGHDAARRRVLVVDDEPMVREVAATYLEREGFLVSLAADGESALRLFDSEAPDLVVLDLMLPKVDGYSVLSDLRSRSTVPVILLTARSDEPDRVAGLEMGADDYVVKPFSPRELAARVRSVLRRARPQHTSSRMEFPGLTIDGSSREVAVDDQLVDVTAREFDLLEFLASSPRQVFSRGQLLEQVWDSSADFQDSSTVTVHVRRLRHKIEPDPNEPRWIKTVWGVGYRFDA